MRAVWVPYLSLDMTKEADKSYAAFQRKFNDIIAKAKNSGANTLVVHVRSHGDAYYPSNYYPWTHFLSGTQGAVSYTHLVRVLLRNMLLTIF